MGIPFLSWDEEKVVGLPHPASMSGHGGMSPRGGLTRISGTPPGTSSDQQAETSDAGTGADASGGGPLRPEDIERLAPTAVGTAGARTGADPDDADSGDGIGNLTARTALQRILEAFAGTSGAANGARTVPERDRALRSLESLLAARAERARARGDGTETDAAGADLNRLERLLEMNRELDSLTGTSNPSVTAGDGGEDGGIPSSWNVDVNVGAGDDGSDAATNDAEANAHARSLGVDLQVALRWLEQTVPVWIILAMVYSLRNVRAIVTFAWLFATCLRLNDALKAQVAARSERKPRESAYLLCVVVMTVTCAYAVLPDDGCWDRVAFKPVQTGSMGFTESVWQCAVADVIARFIAVSAKACALLATKAPDIGVGALSRAFGLVSGGSGGKDGGNRKMRGTGGAGSASPSVPLVALTTEGLTHRTPGPPHVSGDGTAGAAPGRVPVDRGGRSAHRRLTARLSLLEHLSLIHRTALPIPVWFAFFRDENELGSAAACLAAGAYLAVKLRAALERAHGVRGAAKQCWSAEGAAYGTPASAEDVAECGDCCAICQERYERPVRLGCEHVFCEECVGEWFERERTCPLCRATVASAGARSYGDGGTVMYAHVF